MRYVRAVHGGAGRWSGPRRERPQGRTRKARRPSTVPPRALVSVILSWAVLAQPVGGADVMRAQIAHLMELAEAPHVSIRVLEASSGAHNGLDGSFRLLTVGADCVEMAALPGAVGIRDSKNPDGPRLALPPSTAREFLARIKHGNLDIA